MKPTPQAIEILDDAGYTVEREGRCWRVTKGGKLQHPTPFASGEWINNLAKEISHEEDMGE